jgi:hypothetical protein
MHGKNAEKRKNRSPLKLKQLLTGQSAEYVIFLSELRKLWTDNAGGVAAFSFPYRLNNGTLFVAVTEQIWIAELAYIKGDILAKLASAGLEANDIRFTLASAKLNAAAPKRKLRDLTEAEESWVAQIAAELKTELKPAFTKALNACLKADRLGS